MNTSRSTIALDQYEKDMSAWTYIQNLIDSIRLEAIGQSSNDHGIKILTAMIAMIETHKPVKPNA